MSLKKIKRAIISVNNKSNLKIILPILKKLKVELISSGGTYKVIKKMKYNCTEISDFIISEKKSLQCSINKIMTSKSLSG